jgi:hypothetical protein
VLNITVGLACTAADIAARQNAECSRYQSALSTGNRAEMNDALYALDVADAQMDALRAYARI